MSRRERHRLPDGLRSSVEIELRRVGGSAPGGGMAELVRAWPSAVGEAIARNAWPARVTRDGRVVVHVASSAWAQELTQLETTVRDRLGAAAPAGFRFMVGPLPEVGPSEVAEPRMPSVTPSEGDLAAAEALTCGIEDQDLRERVKRAAALSLAAARPARPDRPV
jgi:hypothetical protein